MGLSGSKLPPRTQAGRGLVSGAAVGLSRLPFAVVTSAITGATVGPITAALIARSHGVADPRWSPSGNRLAWSDSFDGRTRPGGGRDRRLDTAHWS